MNKEGFKKCRIFHTFGPDNLWKKIWSKNQFLDNSEQKIVFPFTWQKTAKILTVSKHSHSVLLVEMFYLNTIEQLFLFVEQLDQFETYLPYLIVDF